MKKAIVVLSLTALAVLGAGPAYGWHTNGRVLCDVNANGVVDAEDIPLAGVVVTVVQTDGLYTRATITDSNGYFFIPLLDIPASYEESLSGPGLPGDSIFISPPANSFTYSLGFSPLPDTMTHDWLISSVVCREQGCWLTGGGVKFEPVTGLRMAERGPKITMGGNVFPSCSGDAGDGGNWNLVDHDLKLHFQGTQISQVACGNVPGISSGSTSPRTPYNYIEFQGTGTLKGISGNKVDFGEVSFFARAEDRNEPGNERALEPNGGTLIDRFFLVVRDSSNAVVYLLDFDGNAATVDPITITGGNLQLHISSCP